MSKQHNYYLNRFRKQTDITQSDIGFLMNRRDDIHICRCETGKRTPSIEMLLVYHLLFNAPIDSFLQIQKDDVIEDLIVRVGLLIYKLKQMEATPTVKSRIAFLTSVQARLTA
jgi:transcriptional regulator with XRE-family HTH domain